MKRAIFIIGIFACIGIINSPSRVTSQTRPRQEPSPSSNQQAGSDSTQQSERVSQNEIEPERLTARVIDVMRSTADDAARWDDKTAAASVQAQVADLMWQVDAEIARQYLVRAWEAASRVEETSGERSRFRNASPRANARQEVMLVARQRAPELAQRWLEQMAEETESERNGQTRGAFDDRTARSTVLLQMAMQMVERDPATAAQMATESLSDGVSFGFQQFLVALQARDAQLAANTFRAALNHLRANGMRDPNEILILYSYLYTPGIIRAANTAETRGSSQMAVGRDRPQITALANLNPTLAVEFLRLASELLVDAPLPTATANPTETARAQLSAISALMARMTPQLQEQTAALQRRAQQIETDARFSPTPARLPSDFPEPRTGESREEYALRRVETMEERAAREPAGLGRDILYAQAAVATPVEGYERASALAGRIADEALRVSVTNWLVYRAALHFIRNNDFNHARRLSARNTDAAQRAAMLIVGAQRLAQARDEVQARDWLHEAGRLIQRLEPDSDTVRLALGAVSTYGTFDSVAALEALHRAVGLINRSSVPLSRDERVPSLARFGGFTLQDFTYGTSGFGLRAATSVFGAEQFESALGALNRIERPEARGIAIVTLARKHLEADRRSASPERSATTNP